jgi:hypothetical protein
LTDEVLVHLKYSGMSNCFINNKLSVRINDKWGCIDINGKVVIPIKFDYVDDFLRKKTGKKTDKAKFREGDKWGAIDDTGRIIIPALYDEIMWWNDDLKGKLNGGNWQILKEKKPSVKHIKEWNEFFSNYSQSL